ncbi:SPOR domain-containing protein [Thalassotalea mangrovi]|uniref:Cell division protein FtsN n=1 Tax=Thalassotalea mangrovi TaxID=2572245 RepID=A0A4U1B4R2_9GAMM|nr:SPOR domain-containing protein [Thalassotalea mangrovi]TKB45334.1 cell division protein FtsN [Thalassotalea mangrovi]
MAHKDYISKTRPKKKNSPYRAKRPVKKQAPADWKFRIISIAALIIVVGVVYFLNFIDENPGPLADQGQSIESQIAQVQQQAQQPEENDDPLPEKPKEELAFWTTLPEKKVKVSGGYEVADPQRRKLQCASLRSRAKAEELKAKIAFTTGQPSDVRRSEGSNGVWYKVVLGPFENKRSAERIKHELRSNQINGCIIYPWS